MLDRRDRIERQRAAARERKREQRRMDKAKTKKLRIEMHYHRIVEALLISTRLTEAQALDQAKVEAEVAEVLDRRDDRRSRRGHRRCACSRRQSCPGH